MKRVIEGKLYNTDTAEEIHVYEPHYDTGDFHYFIERLYVTSKGNFFIAGEGGPMSTYSEHLGNGSTGGGSGIRPVGTREAADWLEQSGGSEVLTEDERFMEFVEEA